MALPIKYAAASEAKVTKSADKRTEMLLDMEKRMYEHAFLVPYWNVWDINFLSPELAWDPDLHKSTPLYAQGQNQREWEYIWKK